MRRLVVRQPVGRGNGAPSEERDVVAKMPGDGVLDAFLEGEEVEEQGREPLVVEEASHPAIPRAAAPTPAALGEEDGPARTVGHGEVAGEDYRTEVESEPLSGRSKAFIARFLKPCYISHCFELS